MILTALVLSRWLHFAAAMLLFGGTCLFLGGKPGAGIDRTLRGLAVVNLVTGLAWFLSESAVANDGWAGILAPDFLQAMLTDTRFGRVWGPHLVLAVALALWPSKGSRVSLALLSGLNLGSMGLTGHAVLPSGWLGQVHQAISVLHLLAGGYWVGALAFVLVLIGEPEQKPVLMRFSTWGHLAVGGVILTGVAKTAVIQTSRGSVDPGMVWGALLAVKILAVLAMVGLALNNRYRLVPLGQPGLRGFRRGTLAEIALAAVVLMLVSLLATLSPFGQG